MIANDIIVGNLPNLKSCFHEKMVLKRYNSICYCSRYLIRNISSCRNFTKLIKTFVNKYLSLIRPDKNAPHRRPKNVTCCVSFKRGARSQTKFHSWMIVFFHSVLSCVQDVHFRMLLFSFARM